MLVPYTQVANAALQDALLSAKAKGIYAQLRSKPDGWDFSAERISWENTDGRKGILSGLKELEKAGYITRKRHGDGRVVHTIHNEPQSLKGTQATEEPQSPNGTVPKGHGAERAPISKKEELVRKKLNKKECTLTPSQEAQAFFDPKNGHGVKNAMLQTFVKAGAEEEAVRREFRKFWTYWTEPNKSGTKQRWQLQPTFDIKRRLVTWMERAQKYEGSSTSNKYQAGRV